MWVWSHFLKAHRDIEAKALSSKQSLNWFAPLTFLTYKVEVAVILILWRFLRLNRATKWKALGQCLSALSLSTNCWNFI